MSTSAKEPSTIPSPPPVLLEELALLTDEFFQKLTKMARELGEARDHIQQQQGKPAPMIEDNGILIVEGDGWLTSALLTRPLAHQKMRSVVSGGIALDAASTQTFQLIVINEQLPDLPGHMVARSLLGQGLDSLIVLFRRPGATPGRMELIEDGKIISLLGEMQDAGQLIAQIPDLCEIYRRRKRERRYLLAFREENYDLLRRYREIRQKLGSK